MTDNTTSDTSAMDIDTAADAEDNKTPLEARIEQLETELAEAQETAARFRADYDNLQKRTEKWKQRVIRTANREFVAPLLDPLTHLQMASKQLDDQGLDMVVKQLWQTLESQGLERLIPAGEPFDVETMEAVERTGEGNTVVAVRQPGYRLNDTIIRHAKVVVGDDS